MGTRARARHRLFRPWSILRIPRTAWCRVLEDCWLRNGRLRIAWRSKNVSMPHELMLAALLGEPGCHGPGPRATSEPDGGLV